MKDGMKMWTGSWEEWSGMEMWMAVWSVKGEEWNSGSD